MFAQFASVDPLLAPPAIGALFKPEHASDRQRFSRLRARIFFDTYYIPPFDPASPFQGRATELHESIANSISETKELLSFAGGKRYRWIQEFNLSGIKELNETLWKTSGAEALIELLNSCAHDFFRFHSQAGNILHSDYKRIFVGTDLSPKTFASLFLNGMRTVGATFLEQSAPRTTNWKRWMRQNTSVAAAHHIWQAHYWLTKTKPYTWDLPVASQAISVNGWRQEACLWRKVCLQEAGRCGLDWEPLLRSAQSFLGRSRGGLIALRKELAPYGGAVLASHLATYFQFLQMGHFLQFRTLLQPGASESGSSADELLQLRKQDPFSTPRLSWQAERRIAFHLGRNASSLVTFDIVGYGEFARLKQDEWIANGADFGRLNHVYDDTTAAKQELFRSIHRDISQRIGGPCGAYTHEGDDATFFIPAGVSAAQLASVKAYIEQCVTTGRSCGDEGRELFLKVKSNGLQAVEPPWSADAIAKALDRSRLK